MKDSCLKRLRNQDRQYYLGGRVGIQFGELCCCSAEAGKCGGSFRNPPGHGIFALRSHSADGCRIPGVFHSG
jgi:hypothetical protein